MGYVEDVGYIGLDNIHIISTEVHGNDLVVKFTFFNNFASWQIWKMLILKMLVCGLLIFIQQILLMQTYRGQI